MRAVLGGLLLVVVTALAGCASNAGLPQPVPKIGEAKIDVDTPGLRMLKRQAGIEDCRPAAEGASENGLPKVTLPCFGGGPDVRLDRLAGPIVLNVWANWCGPCREELPYYQRLHEELGDRATVIGVDYQDPQTELAMDLLRQSGVTYPQVADPETTIRTTAPRIRALGVPILVLVDGDGRVTYAAGGVMRSYAQLTGLVRQHLGIAL